MKINGFQKMTLLDFPGKVACIVFTAGCNLRCPFCHNAFLVTKIDKTAEIPKEEILEYINRRKGILDGVCISGGEPLSDDEIFDFIKEIRKTGLKIKIDTNGTFPERLKSLVNENLVDYVAMDIKNCPEKYAMTVGVENFDISPVLESINFLLEGNIDYEFRTTVVKELHTTEDISKIAKLIAGAPRYFIQNFVDSGNIIENGLHGFENDELEILKSSAMQHMANTNIRG